MFLTQPGIIKLRKTDTFNAVLYLNSMNKGSIFLEMIYLVFSLLYYSQCFFTTLFSLLLMTILHGRYYTHHFTEEQKDWHASPRVNRRHVRVRFSCWSVLTPSHFYPLCHVSGMLSCFVSRAVKRSNEMPVGDILIVFLFLHEVKSYCSCIN